MSLCQLMERCDGYGGNVKVLREVWRVQLSESVTVIREV